MDKDFNRIREWLTPLLQERGLSVERFANEVGLTRTSVYRYMNDEKRPDSDSMARMCHFLGRPLEEGLQQYTPRIEGRPKGFSPGPKPATSRS